MSIQQRGGSWQATVTSDGQRWRRQFQDEAAAKVWEAEARLALLRGEQPDLGRRATDEIGKPRTMQALRDYVHKRHWAGQKAEEKTLINADAVVKLLGPNRDPRMVDTFAIDGLIVKLRDKGNSNATINRKLAALSRMLNVAQSIGAIDRAPRIERFKETERRRFRFTDKIWAEATGIMKYLGDEDMADFITVSLDTGLRVGESLRILWREAAPAITVFETKSGKNRVIPQTERVKAVLGSRMARLDPLPERVFHGLTPRHIAWRWSQLRESLGLRDEPSFVPHILRHEFCSRLADAGVNASSIQRLAGHSTLTMTQRYINMAPAALEAAIKQMENV